MGQIILEPGPNFEARNRSLKFEFQLQSLFLPPSSIRRGVSLTELLRPRLYIPRDLFVIRFQSTDRDTTPSPSWSCSFPSIN